MTGLISIEVHNLTKTFNKTIALDNVSLNFEPAKMHGIIGPEGAGKTTLFRTLLGLLKPNEGRVVFLNEEKPLTSEAIRLKTAYMSQQQSLYPDLSVDEHLNFFKALYQIDETEFEKQRKELLDITQLEPFVERLAGELSGGMYKKLGLMCALLRSPDIMLLDEPTNGVDPISRREFWDLLYKLLDRKILILVSTAYMDEAERCSVVHLLESGKVVGEGEPQALLAKRKVSSFDELFLKSGKPHE